MSTVTPATFQGSRERAGVAPGDRGEDGAVEKSHKNVSQGPCGITGILGLKLSWCLLERQNLKSRGYEEDRLGHAGKGYVDTCCWEVSHAASRALKEPTDALPVRGLASILRANGKSLISLRNPQTRSGRGGEETEKAPPLHLPDASLLPFSSQLQNALGLGKESMTRPPSVLLSPVTI